MSGGLSRLSPLELLRGASYPLRGYAVLRKHRGLLRYALAPIVLTALALAGSAYLAASYHDDLLHLFWQEPKPGGNAVIAALHRVAAGLSFLLAFSALAFFCVAISTVCAAPFNDALSEAVEERETGRAALPFSLRRHVREIVQSLGFAAFRLMLYALIAGPLWLLSLLVPGVGHLLYLGAWLLLGAAYFALDYVDWPATRRGLSLRARFGLLARHPLRMLGFGLAVWACLFVPLLDLVFMPLSVAGGTLLYLDLEAGTRGARLRTT
jgi:uncharacterized protein involved in cysteine biosynthesis